MDHIRNKTKIKILKLAIVTVRKNGECMCLAIKYAIMDIGLSYKWNDNAIIVKEFELLKFKPKNRNKLENWWPYTNRAQLKRTAILNTLIRRFQARENKAKRNKS